MSARPVQFQWKQFDNIDMAESKIFYGNEIPGFDVDIWTRQFDGQPQIDVVDRFVRIVRVRCGVPGFVPKEFPYRDLAEWCDLVGDR